MGEAIQISRAEIIAGEAWERHQRILKLRDDAMISFLALGEELYWFEEEKQYLELDYETFEQYVNSPEVNIGRRSAFMLKGIYQTYVLEAKVQPVALLESGIAKLDRARPFINDETKDEILSSASSLSKYDFFKWLKERFRPDKAELPNIQAQDCEGDGWRLLYGDMRERCLELEDKSFDAIVTDPPYPYEYIELFSDLAKQASRLLVDDGTLLVMSGNMFLPEVYSRLSEHEEEGLHYRWTVSYLMPGVESRAWGRTIWNHWKPIIIFTKGVPRGDWAVDVVTSPAPDKEYHYWGQSLQGMRGLIDSFVLPNSRVLDPFCGGGSTIEAALDLGHECIGIDNDAEAILTIQERLNDKGRKNWLA